MASNIVPTSRTATRKPASGWKGNFALFVSWQIIFVYPVSRIYFAFIHKLCSFPISHWRVRTQTKNCSTADNYLYMYYLVHGFYVLALVLVLWCTDTQTCFVILGQQLTAGTGNNSLLYIYIWQLQSLAYLEVYSCSKLLPSPAAAVAAATCWCFYAYYTHHKLYSVGF